MTDKPQTTRNRPASSPFMNACGVCHRTFIGEKHHQFCGQCVKVVAKQIAKEQGVLAWTITRGELEAKLAEHGVRITWFLNDDCNAAIARVFIDGFEYEKYVHELLSLKTKDPFGVVMAIAQGELARRQCIVEQAAAGEMREALTAALDIYCLSVAATRDAYERNGELAFRKVEAIENKIKQAIALATYTPERWAELQEEKE
jgi:hypothetical protein